MHFVPLSMLAAALMAAAAPSPEPAEITIKIDLNSDNDPAGNFHTPLENPRLDITEGHGNEPTYSEPQYNLHYNFSLIARVTQTPKVPNPSCARPPYPEFSVGYPRGVSFAQFGIDWSNFTLCRGKVIYDNSVFTVGPDRNPIYVYLGSSNNAIGFKTENVIGKVVSGKKQPDRLYLRSTDPELWFASLNCAPVRFDRVAALRGPEGKGSSILLSSFLFSLSYPPVPKRREGFMLTDWLSSAC